MSYQELLFRLEYVEAELRDCEDEAESERLNEIRKRLLAELKDMRTRD